MHIRYYVNLLNYFLNTLGNLIDMKPQEIDSIYNELREDFAIIGLTGALGSGCMNRPEYFGDSLS